MKPTKPEQVLAEYFLKNKLPYRYTGNYQFWIEDINPDFVNCNGEKVAVEMQGCYWHGCPVCFPKGASNTYDGKVLKGIKRDIHKDKIYAKYGWKVLKIWEHEIKDGSFKQKLI